MQDFRLGSMHHLALAIFAAFSLPSGHSDSYNVLPLSSTGVAPSLTLISPLPGDAVAPGDIAITFTSSISGIVCFELDPQQSNLMSDVPCLIFDVPAHSERHHEGGVTMSGILPGKHLLRLSLHPRLQSTEGKGVPSTKLAELFVDFVASPTVEVQILPSPSSTVTVDGDGGVRVEFSTTASGVLCFEIDAHLETGKNLLCMECLVSSEELSATRGTVVLEGIGPGTYDLRLTLRPMDQHEIVPSNVLAETTSTLVVVEEQRYSPQPKKDHRQRESLDLSQASTPVSLLERLPLELAILSPRPDSIVPSGSVAIDFKLTGNGVVCFDITDHAESSAKVPCVEFDPAVTGTESKVFLDGVPSGLRRLRMAFYEGASLSSVTAETPLSAERSIEFIVQYPNSSQSEDPSRAEGHLPHSLFVFAPLEGQSVLSSGGANSGEVVVEFVGTASGEVCITVDSPKNSKCFDYSKDQGRRALAVAGLIEGQHRIEVTLTDPSSKAMMARFPMRYFTVVPSKIHASISAINSDSEDTGAAAPLVDILSPRPDEVVSASDVFLSFKGPAGMYCFSVDPHLSTANRATCVPFDPSKGTGPALTIDNLIPGRRRLELKYYASMDESLPEVPSVFFRLACLNKRRALTEQWRAGRLFVCRDFLRPPL